MLGSVGTEASAYRTAPHWQPPVITGESFASDIREVRTVPQSRASGRKAPCGQAFETGVRMQAVPVWSECWARPARTQEIGSVKTAVGVRVTPIFLDRVSRIK